jgi:serine/threonine protein kinase
VEKQSNKGLHLTLGSLFARRYTVECHLGTGGMGQVYLVQDSMLDGERVAMKVLHPHLAHEERQRKRFLREVQLMRKVTNPHVVRTFDAGIEAELLYFTMEYVNGFSLKEIIEKARLSLNEACRLAEQLVDGLSSIHDAGIIHRDLKPANVIVCPDHTIKITDFGVARPYSSDLTAEDELVGSSCYIPPEIWRGEEASTATDYYALGVILYQLLTQILPFDGKSSAEVMAKHLHGAIKAPHEIDPEIPLELSLIILRLLEKDVDRRLVNSEALIEVLRSASTEGTSGPSVAAESRIVAHSYEPVRRSAPRVDPFTSEQEDQQELDSEGPTVVSAPAPSLQEPKAAGKWCRIKANCNLSSLPQPARQAVTVVARAFGLLGIFLALKFVVVPALNAYLLDTQGLRVELRYILNTVALAASALQLIILYGLGLVFFLSFSRTTRMLSSVTGLLLLAAWVGSGWEISRLVRIRNAYERSSALAPFPAITETSIHLKLQGLRLCEVTGVCEQRTEDWKGPSNDKAR